MSDFVNCWSEKYQRSELCSISSGWNKRIVFWKVFMSSCIKPHLQWVCIKKQERISYIKPTSCFFFSRRMLALMLFYRCLMSSQISWGQDSRLTQRHFQLPNKLLDIHKHNLIFTVFAKRKKDVQNIFFNSFINVPWKLALHLKIGLITIIFRVVGVVLNRPFLIIVVGYTL